MQAKSNPFKRHKTRFPGVYFRVKADESRTYFVHYEGKFVSAGSTEKEALALQADLRSRKAKGERVVVNDKTTFAQLAEEWFAAKTRRLRPRTAAEYRDALDNYLLPRFGKWRVTAIDAQEIAQFIRELEDEGRHSVDARFTRRPLTRRTIDNICKPLQGVLNEAAFRRLIPANPFALLTQDHRPPVAERDVHEWEQSELDALCAASESLSAQTASRYDYAPLLRLAAVLGLRLGELLGLQWHDFDRDRNTLRVERQWTRFGEYGPPKTKAGRRTIDLTEPALAEARRILLDLRMASAFSQDAHPIFASRKGTPLTHRNVTKRGWEPARTKANLDDVNFHDLRHAAASRLIDSGLSPVDVAAILGHEDPHITLKVYAARFDQQAKAKARRVALER